jgi:8-oxo-dGTP diphosphatase
MPISDQGVSNQRYQLIPRTLIFLTSGDKILLLKGAPQKKIWANQYNGIGGHVEQGEDVYSAAQRELEEESALSHVPLDLCGIVTIDTGAKPGIVLFIFHAEIELHQALQSPEGELHWLSIADLHNLPLVEDLPRIIPRVLKYKTGDSPFFAKYSYNKDDQLTIQFAETN